MKKTIIFASVTLATLFAFSSCQKETLQDNGTTNGVRIITAEFENNATKTTLNSDGVTPEWVAGDVLRVLSATAYQDVTLAADDITGNKITFTTSLEGTLYAVYPASATTMESCGGNITFTIPAIQDGTFASANICVAKSTEEDENNKDNLIFSNATAVLKITTAADVVGVDVTAANKIAGNVTASFDGSAVSLTTTALDKNYVSAVGASAPTGNVFYLAVAPVTTGSATANCYKTAMKGTAAKSSKELQRNIIYSMDLSSLTIDNSDLTGQRGILNDHEYVVVKCGDKNLKWATMNVGATTLTGTGDYYMWGAVEKPYSSLSDKKFTFYSGKPSSYINNTWNAGKGFSPLNCQFTNNIEEYSTYGFGAQNVLTKYSASKNGNSVSGTADGMTVLESCDDAATCNWGSTWRMPSGGNASEFIALYNATYWSWDDTDKGYYVYAPNPSTDAGKSKDGEGTYNKSDALLFFPAGGMGMDLGVNSFGALGGYWTRTLNSEKPLQAHHFNFAKDSGVNTDVTSSNARSIGFLIRPVSD